MYAISHRKAGASAGFVPAALFAVSLFTSDQVAMHEGLTDDFISPWCRVGSLASWEGRPCVLSLRTGSVEITASLGQGR